MRARGCSEEEEEEEEGVATRLCRVGSGDKKMNALLYFRWLSVGGM